VPYVFWKINTDSLSSPESSINLEGKDCHISLSVIPLHNGDETLFNSNNFYLENLVKKIFSMSDVYICNCDKEEIPFSEEYCLSNEMNTITIEQEKELKDILNIL
jgi:hypothetical protein